MNLSSRKYILHENKVNWGIVWHIITTDGKGHIECSIENDNPNIIFLSGLSVIPELRNQGVGKYLVHISEQLGKENNVEKIRLNIDIDKKNLLTYYINLGYKLYGQDDEYFYMIKYV